MFSTVNLCLSLLAVCCGSLRNRGEVVRERGGGDERGGGFPSPHLNSVSGANLSWGERTQAQLLPNTGTVSKGDICAGGAAQANVIGKQPQLKKRSDGNVKLRDFCEVQGGKVTMVRKGGETRQTEKYLLLVRSEASCHSSKAPS